MKANEFVKKHGLQYTINLVRVYPIQTHITDDGRMFINENTCAEHIRVQLSGLVKIEDLKRLVDSHELVESFGGLERVKKAIDGKHIGYTHFYLHPNDRYVFLDHYVDFIPDQAQHIGMFNKAIVDVESCFAQK